MLSSVILIDWRGVSRWSSFFCFSSSAFLSGSSSVSISEERFDASADRSIPNAPLVNPEFAGFASDFESGAFGLAFTFDGIAFTLGFFSFFSDSSRSRLFASRSSGDSIAFTPGGYARSRGRRLSGFFGEVPSEAF